MLDNQGNLQKSKNTYYRLKSPFILTSSTRKNRSETKISKNVQFLISIHSHTDDKNKGMRGFPHCFIYFFLFYIEQTFRFHFHLTLRNVTVVYFSAIFLQLGANLLFTCERVQWVKMAQQFLQEKNYFDSAANSS